MLMGLLGVGWRLLSEEMAVMVEVNLENVLFVRCDMVGV